MSTARENHKQLGARGEDLALGYLRGKGYTLVEKNFRNRSGEIDLILDSPEGVLVFVEVKTDRSGQAGIPEGWVQAKKMRQLQRLAQRFCWEKKQMERDMRFDVVGISLRQNGEPEIRHLENAFLPDASGYF